MAPLSRRKSTTAAKTTPAKGKVAKAAAPSTVTVGVDVASSTITVTSNATTLTVKTLPSTPKAKAAATPKSKAKATSSSVAKRKATPATKAAAAKAATPTPKKPKATPTKTAASVATPKNTEQSAASAESSHHQDEVADLLLSDNSFSATIDHVGGSPVSGKSHWLRSDYSRLQYPNSPSSPPPKSLLATMKTTTAALWPGATTTTAAPPSTAATATATYKKPPANKTRKGRPQGLGNLCLMLLPLLLVLVEFLCRTYLDVPLANLCRNMVLPATPPPVKGLYQCTEDSLAKDVTIVVTVKDACSQAPGFIKALHDMVPDSVHLIYTYPNFSSCANVPGMETELAKWQKVTKLPLGLRVSPMSGWVDAVPHIRTPYALLLHNDGYALDPFFACELVGALKARKAQFQQQQQRQLGEGGGGGEVTGAGGPFVVSAPMLFESKADRSLAAHATQANLRLVREGGTWGRTVRHDHSVARALNRGYDFQEGPQSEFLEDHGFMIETDKIATVVDPHASYTLEYIDMIMTIRSHNWQVLFVPTARLEFRVTEFSWRDIPYFMHKRSEATCHGTRDYLTAKWKANFPNTGFWTYIKYTIVEQHVYGVDELSQLPWKDSASIAFGFFQMIGFNRYALGSEAAQHMAWAGAAGAAAGPASQGSSSDKNSSSSAEPHDAVDFLTVVEKLEAGWRPGQGLTVVASRERARKEWTPKQVRKTALPIEDVLETKEPSGLRIEADMPLEYLPFAALELKYVHSKAGSQQYPPPHSMTSTAGIGADTTADIAAGTATAAATATANAATRAANSAATTFNKQGTHSIPASVLPLCGLVVQHPGTGPGAAYGGSVSCWVNLPTFKSNGLLIRFLDKFAALIKLPSRVTTYIEMAMGSTNSAKAHVKMLNARLLSGKALEGAPTAKLITCEHDEESSGGAGGGCTAEFHLGPTDQVLQFMGRPPSAWELLAALDA